MKLPRANALTVLTDSTGSLLLRPQPRRWAWWRAAAGLLLWPFLLLARDQAQWGETFSRNMISAETNLPMHFDPATGRQIKWSVELDGFSWPICVRKQANGIHGIRNHGQICGFLFRMDG